MRKNIGSGKHPIDLDLWRMVKHAPDSEKWKWDWGTWDPIIRPILANKPAMGAISAGKIDFKELLCPVCGTQHVYAYFLAVDIATHSSQESLRPVFIGDRWFGCDNCNTQVRDRGELPAWMNMEDIVWALEEFKTRAQRKLDDLGV